MYKFTVIKSKKDCLQSKNKIQTRIIIFRNDETITEYKKDVPQDKDGKDVPK